MSGPPTRLLQWTEPDPDSAKIDGLVAALAASDGAADLAAEWPAALWDLIEKSGTTRWSLPAEFGGESCARPLLVQRYARLAEGSLTAVFILSQHDAGVRRLLEPRANPTAAPLAARNRGRPRVRDGGDLAPHHLSPARHHRSRARPGILSDRRCHSLGHRRIRAAGPRHRRCLE